jgi:hypothetical protein
MQGPHQISQKSSSTTLPLRSPSVGGEPLTPASTWSGAAFRPTSLVRLFSTSSWRLTSFPNRAASLLLMRSGPLRERRRSSRSAGYPGCLLIELELEQHPVIPGALVIQQVNVTGLRHDVTGAGELRRGWVNSE